MITLKPSYTEECGQITRAMEEGSDTQKNTRIWEAGKDSAGTTTGQKDVPRTAHTQDGLAMAHLQSKGQSIISVQACLIRDWQQREHPEGSPDCPHKD